jgi:hypothetical protein
MKPYVIFFLILKAAIMIQFVLILTNKQTTDSRVYIITEIVFKTSLFLFMEYFLFHFKIEGLAFEDKMIISFAGGLLFYDAWMHDFPQLIKSLKKHGNIPESFHMLWF